MNKPEDKQPRIRLSVAAIVAIGGALMTACSGSSETPPIDTHHAYRLYTVAPGDQSINDIVRKLEPRANPMDMQEEVIDARMELDPLLSRSDATDIQQGDTLPFPENADPEVTELVTVIDSKVR